MSETCIAYNFPEHQCSDYPSECKDCAWSTGRKAQTRQVGGLMWRHAEAGRSFGKDTIVLYDGDPDARLVRCAVNDCIYISVDELKKLPVENEQKQEK